LIPNRSVTTISLGPFRYIWEVETRLFSNYILIDFHTGWVCNSLLYSLGWAWQTASGSLYKLHAGKREKEEGVGLKKGDIVTLQVQQTLRAYTDSGSTRPCFLLIPVNTQLDIDKQTLAFKINDSEIISTVSPFTGVRGPVIPAISVGNTTVCRVTIENCRQW